MSAHNSRLSAKALSLFLSILLTSQYAFAGSVGKVTYAEGRVDIMRPGSEQAAPVREGETIFVGDSIRTKSNSKTEIIFDDLSIVRIAQNSRVTVQDYQFNENKTRKTADILLERGKARSIIAKSPTAADFIISTPNAKGTVTGSDIFAFYQSGNSGMLVAEGRLSVSSLANPQKSVIVPAGNSVLIPLEEIPKEPRAYLELEKKIYEQDTNVPPKREIEGGVIRGAITKLAGDVRITTKGQTSAHQADINEIVSEGDKIETGNGGAVEIRFDNGNAINLKPNSNITIFRLVFNPQTGEYENIFESTAGRIRARIENLKGKSKFEVKTPTATCGARGTIMYMNILPNIMQAFFEGGGGYITSILSGMTKVVDVGENAFADDTGAVSDPTYTPEGERESFGEGWEPGTGTEGYSAPEGTLGSYFSNSDTGPDTGAPDADAPSGHDGPYFFSDLPFTPGGGGPPPSISISVDGSFVDAAASSLTATVISNAADIAAPWIGMEPFTASGSYLNPGNNALWSGAAEGNNGSAGGSIIGWMGGSWHSWEGVLSALYIDPGSTNDEGVFSHIAGFMFGYFSGTTAAGGFTGNTDDEDTDDVLEGVVIVPVNVTGILPEDLADAVTTEVITNGSTTAYGTFDAGNGYVDVDFDRTHMFIPGVLTEDGHDWGIWKDSYAGTYKNPNGLKEWSGIVGGGGVDEGYHHFTTIEGVDDLDGALRIDIMGTYLSNHNLGSFLGTILGTYNGAGIENFSAVGFGNYVESSDERPLTSSGRLSASLYDNGTSTGSLSGLIGTTASDEPMVSIGTFTRNIGEPFIWFSDADKGIYTNNPDSDTYTTYDGGAFVGLTGGFGEGNVMTGRTKALYIGPDGDAGIHTADLGGVYSAASGAYMMAGDITSEQVIEDIGIAAENLYGSVWTTGGGGMISGSFEGGGTLIGNENFVTMSIANGATAQPWGIYGQRFYGAYMDATDSWMAEIGGHDAFGAYYDSSAGNFSSDYGYWIGGMLNGTWSGGEFTADTIGAFLTYTRLGILAGDVFGIYNTEEETWQGVGLGEWAGAPLTFTGKWGVDAQRGGGTQIREGPGSIYYNNGGNITLAGHDTGLIGAVSSPWSSPAEFFAMGSYSDDYPQMPHIWNTVVQSYNAPAGGIATTIDGAAFYGFTGGIWNNETMDGAIAALYIDPDGSAGLLRGDVSGDYYPDLEMWKATGALTPTERVQDIGIAPEDLSDYIYRDDIENDGLYGDFGDGFSGGENYIYGWQDNGYTYALGEDAGWGIFDIKLGGENYYSNPKGLTTWSATMGAIQDDDEDEDEDEDNSSYWLVDIMGTWKNNEIKAEVSGNYISLFALGTIEGDLFGVYDGPDEEGYGTWIATALGSYSEEPLTLSGYWGEEERENSLYYNDEGDIERAGEEYGLIGSTRPNWWNERSFPILAMGEYKERESAPPYIWNTSIYSDDTTRDGAAFYGYTAGLWMEGKDEGMDGAIAALYIDPDGNAGVLRGDVSGDYYPGLDMWKATGALTPTQKQQDTGIAPEDLSYYVYRDGIENDGLYGDFGGDFSIGENYIYGRQDYGYTYALREDAGWGIFDIKLGDENYYSNPKGLTTWSATMGAIQEEDEYDDSYWLVDIVGTWEDNEIRADVFGHFISDTNLGTIEGDLFGVYDGPDEEGYGTWIATALGSYSEEPLTFSGYWGEDTLYYNDEGDIERAGEEYGLIGSATPNWWNEKSFPILAMGEYEERKSSAPPYIWNTSIYSDDTTRDGAAFYGYTAGLWMEGKDEGIDGAIAALYIDPDGNAGLLRGDVSGDYYTDLEMWMVTGALTPTEIVQDIGIDPKDLRNHVNSERLRGELDGGFGQKGSGYIEGWSDRRSNTSFIDDGDYSQPWGIYDLKLEGDDSYYNPDGSKIWTGEIYGEGQFGYNYSAGIMGGPIFGLYDESEGSNEGYWVLTSIGTWGSYYLEEGLEEESGAYYGLAGGVWEDGIIKGGMAAIYVQPLDEDLYDMLQGGELSGSGRGRFEGGGVIETRNLSGAILNITDQPWGIWGLVTSGTYTGPTSPWRLALGGRASSGDSTFGWWFGTLNGEEWSDGRLEGDFNGILIVPTEGTYLKGGVVSGGAIGDYIDVDVEGTGTWEAAAVGQWVEVTELLDPAQLGFDIAALDDFVSVPITEVYSSIMTGAGSFTAGGVLSAIMDLSLYATSPSAVDGILAALIQNGSYSGNTGPGWALNFVNGGDTATLSGTQWSDNEWLANLSGTVGGNSISGQAAGTYTNPDGNGSGAFSGVGAGTWAAPE